MAKKINYASMFTLRADGRYMGTYTDAYGKRHSVYDRDPEKLYYKLQTAQSEKVLTFGQVLNEWEREHVETLERGTQQTYRAPIRTARETHGNYALEAVTSAEVNRLMLREKDQGYSYKHAATLKSIYKQVFDFAIIKGYMQSNPAQVVKVPRGLTRGRREAPENDVLAKVKANADKPFGLFPLLLLYTGFRTEEAAALQWGDIDFKKKLIHCRRAVDLHGTPIIKDTKTAAGVRDVPLLAGLAPELKRQKGPSNEYVFNIDGKILTRAQISSRWINWCRSAGLAEQQTFSNRHRGDKECTRTEWRPLITPHQLRHGYATVLFEAGIDELTAMSLMGHADIVTTRSIYTHLRQAKKAAAVKQLNSEFDKIVVKGVVK